jgi:hypothetical protein
MAIGNSYKLARSIWHLLIIIGIVVLAYLAFTIYKTTQATKQAQLLTKVDNPKRFAMSFDPQGKTPVGLDVEGWKNLTWKSSIYPNNNLRRNFVGGDDCGRVGIKGEARYLLVDTKWNIFWIEITPCSESPTFFGPFASSSEIVL